MTDPKLSSSVLIKKASGHTEPFDVSKLEGSLKKAGASAECITEIVTDIQNWVFDGVTTHKIYARAFRLFKQISTSGALLYKLKKAIFDMGPSGYPFEHLVGELFRRQGYEVQVGQIMEGASICHEMDVIATKDQEYNLMECKFSQNQGHSVSIQVPLYVHSRVDDIAEKLQQEAKFQATRFVAWVVTNGRFSPDSMQYARCKGIQLLGWDYPQNTALKDLIETHKIFPITILSSLSRSNIQKLMQEGIVTCAQLKAGISTLEELGLSKNKQRSVAREIEALLSSTKATPPPK